MDYLKISFEKYFYPKLYFFILMDVVQILDVYLFSMTNLSGNYFTVTSASSDRCATHSPTVTQFDANNTFVNTITPLNY